MASRNDTEGGSDRIDAPDERSSDRPHRLMPWLTALVLALAGFMMSTAAVNSRGHDLRPDHDGDLARLVRSQASHNADQARQVSELHEQINALSRQHEASPSPSPAQRDEEALTGLLPVRGTALRVTLDDAPLTVNPQGVDANMLVVHQQDIQTVVNALWAGGAEAMTIQGQRVIATTGIKCVGNTVVLHGVPYAPPYRIEAMGDVAAMRRALDDSEQVRIYRQYVEAYQLGWKVEDLGTVTMPAHSGSLELSRATPAAR